MYLDPNSRENVFQLFKKIGRIPFAMSRHNWRDTDLVVVLRVHPQGKYGLAYGFPVRDGAPNDHYAVYKKWRDDMELPNAGSYQWRLIDVPEWRLKELEEEFYRDLAPRFAFISPAEAARREREWLERSK